MGGSSCTMSEFAEKDKTSWIRPHKLEYRDDLRVTQLSLIDKFGNNLELRYKNMVLWGVTYRHFWITDGVWILEWGAGDDILNSTIKIRSNVGDREGKDITIEARFEKTMLRKGCQNFVAPSIIPLPFATVNMRHGMSMLVPGSLFKWLVKEF